MKRWIHLCVAAVCVGGAVAAIADSSGPPRSRTGAPAIGGIAAEKNCTDCHGDFALNTGGSVQITGAPNLYVPGRTYDITVRITSTNTAGFAGRGWGFEMTAIRASDGLGAGTFATVAGQGTGIISGTNTMATRRYIQQTDPRYNSAGPVDYRIQWTAPDPGVGGITLYAAAVAANGDGSEGGDWVYTTSKAIQDTVTGVATTSWGQLKSRYR